MVKRYFQLMVIGLLAFFVVSAAAGDFKAQQKIDFLYQMQTISQAALDLRSKLDTLQQTYFSRTYNSGGANEIVIGDLVGTQFEGLSIAEITAIITSAQAFETWIGAGHADNFAKVTK